MLVAGNYDLQAMDSMISDKANLGIAILRNGVCKNSVSTIGEYFEAAKRRELEPYYEPVNEYKILVNEGQIAFVWADATMYKYGVARTRNIDNFTLIKEDGVLQVNNGAPAVGAEAITKVTKGFMDAFPDMVVSLDSLITKSDKTRFHWTLTGTNSVAGETGNKVKISGFQEWTLDKDLLIQKSKGYFDAKEYKRQLENGIDK